MSIVSFSYADVQPRFAHKTELKQFIKSIFNEERKQLDTMRYIFCSDAYLLDINKQFLNHDDYTDIITFDLSETEATIGEIYISADRVKDNGATLGTGFQLELQRVLFHGALHLCGYKDKKKSEIEMMRYKEDYYLRLFAQQLT